MEALETYPDVLTPTHLSEILQVTPSTIRKMAARGDLPCKRVSGRIRFWKPAVVTWLLAGEPSSTDSATQESPQTNSNFDAAHHPPFDGVAGSLATRIIELEKKEN